MLDLTYNRGVDAHRITWDSFLGGSIQHVRSSILNSKKVKKKFLKHHYQKLHSTIIFLILKAYKQSYNNPYLLSSYIMLANAKHMSNVE